MEIKHPREGDVLPVPLEFSSYDPEWVWVYGNAILIAAPAHDTVMLLRLVKFGEMPTPIWIHRLFRHAIREVKERGFHRYMTWLANDVEEEKKLLEIAQRYGAFFTPFQGDFTTGVL